MTDIFNPSTCQRVKTSNRMTIAMSSCTDTQFYRTLRRALTGMLAAGGFVGAAAGCARANLTDGLPNALDCSACHGRPGNPAPPKALDGSSRTSDLGVGAHDAHMLGSSIAGPVACIECHAQPTDMLTHPDINPRPAAMTFGPLATSDGAEPAWDRSAAKCLNTYCHGGTLPDAARRPAPIWIRVDGSQRRCTACHGAPPADPHPSEGACESCHGDVAGPGSSIKNPARHVDGVIDFSSTTSALDLGASQRGSIQSRVGQSERGYAQLNQASNARASAEVWKW